jgi:hypothetical protein
MWRPGRRELQAHVAPKRSPVTLTATPLPDAQPLAGISLLQDPPLTRVRALRIASPRLEQTIRSRQRIRPVGCSRLRIVSDDAELVVQVDRA